MHLGIYKVIIGIAVLSQNSDDICMQQKANIFISFLKASGFKF